MANKRNYRSGTSRSSSSRRYNRENRNTFGKIFTFILILLLLFGIAGIFAFFFGRSDGAAYYVEYSGIRYDANGDVSVIYLSKGEKHEFFVKSSKDEEIDYSVKVISNEATNFSFTVDNELHHFYEGNDANDDYSSLFDLQKDAAGFTLTIPDDMTVESVISEKFGGEIELQDVLSDESSYFVIVVSSEDGDVILSFIFGEIVADITLDTTHIYFGGGAISMVVPPSETLPEEEEMFIRYMVQAAQAQSYEEVQPFIGTIHRLYTDFVIDGSSGSTDLRTAMNAYVAFFRATEDREYTADEAAALREDLGDLMERYALIA